MTCERRTSLILLDGARSDVVEYLAAAGDLPTISRYLLEPGGLVPGTTVFPSTTGVAYLPFLTGCYPGTCNVPGIRWLDRARYGGRWWRERAHVRSYCGYQSGMLDGDLPGAVPTLFDFVPDAVAVCTPFTRGLRPGRNRVTARRALWGGLAHYTGGYAVLDRAVGRELERLAPARHRLVFAVFPGVDGVTHFRDPWHPRVLEMYRGFDRLLSEYADAGGFDGDQLTLLASDHGLSRMDRHTDVSLALEDLGLPTLRHPIIWRRRPRVAVMVSGNASAHVYLRPGERRSRRFTVTEVEHGEVPGVPRTLVRYLAGLPGVALVAGEDGPGRVAVMSAAGRSRVTWNEDGIAYVPETADVLEVGGPARLTEREWLVRTIDGRFPDAAVQLSQIFRAPRAGDLVIAAAEGTDLRRDWEIPEHRSGHGSLVAAHMRCLVASNQRLPGPVRTVDLFAQILQWLQLPVPAAIDGAAPVEAFA